MARDDSDAERVTRQFVNGMAAIGIPAEQALALLRAVEVKDDTTRQAAEAWMEHCWAAAEVIAVLRCVVSGDVVVRADKLGRPRFYSGTPTAGPDDPVASVLARAAILRPTDPVAEREPRKLEEMTEADLGELMRITGIAVEGAFRAQGVERPLYALVVFNDPAVCQYMSNCERASMVAALRETANRLAAAEDLQRGVPQQ